MLQDREGKIMEESFSKGHYVANGAGVNETPFKHVHGLNIGAEIKLASEMIESSEKNEIDRNLKDLGMSR